MLTAAAAQPLDELGVIHDAHEFGGGHLHHLHPAPPRGRSQALPFSSLSHTVDTSPSQGHPCLRTCTCAH